MKTFQQLRSTWFLGRGIAWVHVLGCLLGGLQARGAAPDYDEVILKEQPGIMREKDGEVKFQRPAQTELPASPPTALDFGDALRTMDLARATVQLSDLSGVRMKSSTKLVIIRRPVGTNAAGIRILNGQGYFSSRGAGPQSISFDTPHSKGIAKGTEFLVRVDTNQTEVMMFDGEVELANDVSTNAVKSGWQGIAVPGQPIVVRPILQAQNIVQWWLYYPGILDSAELGLTPAEQAQQAASLASYASGDLLAALESYQANPAVPGSEAQRIYHAGLLLAVGAVDRTEGELAGVSSNAPLAIALRTMIAAVSDARLVNATNRAGNARAPSFEGTKLTASEWLAVSYQCQSTNGLKEALQAARFAVAKSPRFGFGWARVAELEFSFGHTGKAREAVELAIALSPRNAQAFALRGFLLAAENHISDAVVAFNRAIEIDPALANAWLGRGLCRIQRGQKGIGRLDLQTAAILEPTRSLVRSYNGKAFSDAGDARLARKENAFAKKLDPNDPTPWLYSALENWEEYRFNTAVEDLQHSIELNDNRALFRSRLLLDEDLAVRSSSLASVYRSAGMDEVSLGEASRAVSYDYANYSAHLFMSESFDALRDPTRFNLRYETVWFNELLLANMLSPVGATPLSQQISQQEYSRLFARERLGLASDTSYRSDGQVRELGSQYGWFGNTAWSLDVDYQHNDGVRPNNTLDRLEWYTTVKQQLTAQDSLLLLAKYQNYHSGDNFQYYDPTNARPNFTFDETQTPIIFGGYHREWSPGIHTMVLGGRLENDQQFSDTQVPLIELWRDVQTDPSGPIVAAPRVFFDVNHQTVLEGYSAEAQQIFENDRNALIVGGRWQGGNFDTTSVLSNPTGLAGQLPSPVTALQVSENFERVSAYAYDTLKLPLGLRLTGGVTYENMQYPANFRFPPISAGQQSIEQWNPKAAMVWDLTKNITFRGFYGKSLGGVSLDESFRLEPTQLAGFVQDFRTVIPESLVGSVSAPQHEKWDAAFDVKLAPKSYVSLQGGVLHSRVDQTIGAFDFFLGNPVPNVVPSGIQQQLSYEEQSASIIFNQLVSEEWSFSVGYRIAHAELESSEPALQPFLPPLGWHNDEGTLQQAGLQALYSHPSGFFVRADLNWYWQQSFSETGPSSSPTRTDIPGDQFPQLNLFTGYRFPRQHGDLTIGGMNLTGDDYRLNPVNAHVEFPRQRVFYARLRFRF